MTHWANNAEVKAVEDLYRGILRREPDVGIDEKIRRLASGEVTLPKLIEEFLACDEFRNGRSSDPQPSFFNDRSQFGEVPLLLNRLVNSGRARYLVDIGARGRELSNSWDLLAYFGWKGLLIEANPSVLDQIHSQFAGLDYVLACVAASDRDGTTSLYLGENPDISSIHRYAVEAWGGVTNTIEVPMQRASAILKANHVPVVFDLLSIDAEGEDIAVLNDVIGGGFAPTWVIVEASQNFAVKSLQDAPFSEKVRAEYRIVGQTTANIILEHR